MRKAIAIFFLQIIVAVSVQPAIALHFCEGELSHMALYLDDGTCCEGHKKSETDCCDNAKEPIQATDALCHSVMEDHSLCCSTSTLIIETAASGVDGVKSAVWDMDTKELHLQLDVQKTGLEQVSRAIADVGYETELHPADMDAYNALPACCQYKSN